LNSDIISSLFLKTYMSFTYKRINQEVRPPERQTKYSGGYDLHIPYDVVLKPYKKTVVPSGLILNIPIGYVGLIKNRSSFYLKNIKIFEGTIDSDYKEELVFIITNKTRKPVKLIKNMRIGQIVITHCFQKECLDIDGKDVINKEIDENIKERKGGFGSTGSF